MKSSYRRRFGDRPDGRKIRSLKPLNYMIPYIMKTRNTSSNAIKITVDIENMEKYIQKKTS